MNLRPWLRISLAFNALLLGAAGWMALGSSKPERCDKVFKFVTNCGSRVRHKQAPPPAVTDAAPTIVEINAPFSWAAIESADYRVYIANLRGIGCPEQTVRDLVVADVDELFAGRVRELVNSVTGKFWELLSRSGDFEKVVDKKMDELDKMKRERRAVFAKLFGNENPHAEEEKLEIDAAQRETWARLGDFLPEERRVRFITANEDFESARSKIWQTLGLRTAERQAQQKELQDAHERALQAWLTPEEREELRLRRADAAQLRSRLNGLEVSEDEMRALTKYQLAQQKDQMRELLGRERFAVFERAADGRFIPIMKVANRLDLPREVAVQAFDLRKGAEGQVRLIRENKALADEEQQATIRAVGEETRRSLAEAFGAKGFAAYERLDGGWLRQLTETKR